MFNPRVWTYNVGPHSKPHCQNYEHIVYGGEHPKCEKIYELRDCVCVQSEFDSTCGGLFYQDVVTTSISGPKMFRKILLIVSHFIHDLFLLD